MYLTPKKFIKKILTPGQLAKIKEVKFTSLNPQCKRLLSLNSEFKNKHKGQRCFIFGNGPSLNDIDFSLLKNECTFTVNQLPRNNNFEKLHTTYHFWADDRFFHLDETKEEDMELLQIMKDVNTSDNHPIIFYKYSAYDMIHHYHLDQELDIRYYAGLDIDKQLIMKKDVELTMLMPDFPTVIHYIVCIAVYMGFSEIYLLGCDCTGFINTAQAKLKNAKESQYAYKISENEKKRMERVSKLTSIRDELAWYADIFDTYELLNKYCRKHHVKLFNATEGGLLEALPRVSLNDVLQQKS